MLYEISLAAGQSLDLRKNCDIFLKTLMARKNLDFASVWIRKDYLADGQEGEKEQEANHGDAAMLVYAHPEFRIREKTLSSDHPIFPMLSGKDFISVASGDDRFGAIVAENGIDKGIYALFTLNDLGILKLFSMTREDPIDDVELEQISNIISKFTLSLYACLASEQLKGEIAARQAIERILRKQTYDLGERFKELKGLFCFLRHVEHADISFEELFQGTVDLLPPSWQHPECACARIVLGDKEFRQQIFKTVPGGRPAISLFMARKKGW